MFNHDSLESLRAVRRVLIVEDNEDTGEMYRMLLELDGHAVFVASDAANGLELLRSARPDVAIVDIGLPDMSGYELARRFRSEPGAEQLILVALTGYASSADRERSARAGFNHHLTKPIDPDILKALLDGRA